MWWALLLVLEPATVHAASLSESPANAEMSPARRVSRTDVAGGLTLLVESIPGTGAVGSFVYLPGGAGLDPIDAPGLAHLVEHLAFTGTDGAPDTSWDGAVTAVGGWTNGWTDGHGTGLFAEVPAGAASLLIALEVDRLRHLAPTPASIQAQLGVIEAERRSAGPRPNPTMSALLWPSDQSLHVDPMGSPAALSTLSHAQVLQAVRARVTPQGAVWAIVGDVDPYVVRDQVLGQLGGEGSNDRARSGTATHSSELVTPAAPRIRRAWAYDPVPQRVRTHAWAVPGVTAPEASALRLIARMIGGRLSLGPSGGTFTVDRADGHAVLRRLRRFGPGPGALDDLRSESRAQHADVLRSLTTRAETLALCHSWTGDALCDVAALSDEALLTGLDLRDVARKWLGAARALALTQVPIRATSFGRVGHRIQRQDAGVFKPMDPADTSDTVDPSCRICVEHPVEPVRAPVRPSVTRVDRALPVTVDVAVLEKMAPTLDTRAAVVVSLRPSEPLDPAQRVLAEHLLRRSTRATPPGVRVRVGCAATLCRVQVEALPDIVVDATIAALGGLVARHPPGFAWWWRERRQAARWTRLAPRGQLTATEAALERLVLAEGHPLRERSPPPSTSAMRPAEWRSVQARLRASDVHVALTGRVEPELAAALGHGVAGVFVAEAGESVRFRRATAASADRSSHGSVSPAMLPARAALAPRVDPARVVVVNLPGTEVVEVRVAWAAPSGGDPGAESLALAARAWGEDATAVLDRTLRGRLGVTYGLRAGVRDVGGGGLLVVNGALAADEVATALPVLLQLLRDPRLPADDVLGRAQAALREAWTVRRSAVDLAMTLSDAHALGRSVDAHWQHMDALLDVSPREVEDALRTVVSGPSVWVFSGDAGAIEDALIAAGLPTDAVWSAERAVRGRR